MCGTIHDRKCVQALTRPRKNKLDDGYIKSPAPVHRLMTANRKFSKGTRTTEKISTHGDEEDGNEPYKNFWSLIKTPYIYTPMTKRVLESYKKARETRISC